MVSRLGGALPFSTAAPRLRHIGFSPCPNPCAPPPAPIDHSPPRPSPSSFACILNTTRIYTASASGQFEALGSSGFLSGVAQTVAFSLFVFLSTSLIEDELGIGASRWVQTQTQTSRARWRFVLTAPVLIVESQMRMPSLAIVAFMLLDVGKNESLAWETLTEFPRPLAGDFQPPSARFTSMTRTSARQCVSVLHRVSLQAIPLIFSGGLLGNYAGVLPFDGLYLRGRAIAACSLLNPSRRSSRLWVTHPRVRIDAQIRSNHGFDSSDRPLPPTLVTVPTSSTNRRPVSHPLPPSHVRLRDAIQSPPAPLHSHPSQVLALHAVFLSGLAGKTPRCPILKSSVPPGRYPMIRTTFLICLLLRCSRRRWGERIVDPRRLTSRVGAGIPRIRHGGKGWYPCLHLGTARESRPNPHCAMPGRIEDRLHRGREQEEEIGVYPQRDSSILSRFFDLAARRSCLPLARARPTPDAVEGSASHPPLPVVLYVRRRSMIRPHLRDSHRPGRIPDTIRISAASPSHQFEALGRLSPCAPDGVVVAPDPCLDLPRTARSGSPRTYPAQDPGQPVRARSADVDMDADGFWGALGACSVYGSTAPYGVTGTPPLYTADIPFALSVPAELVSFLRIFVVQ
ncbi:hypothetical protein MSAN_01744800 [Mycena sanguinolenta]|uniref:Uncharacterized protein n=1 Tax=Mycena sanguinolenta TaxID=230812 RepID=A0A8H6XZC7_9AGAR|nr:hypothetical protein MSAN_01744800 [Mycena sanguinolenta]